jgi:hypothetical protein
VDERVQTSGCVHRSPAAGGGRRALHDQPVRIAPTTLKSHLRELYRRLDVGTMPEAIHTLWLRDLWLERAA